MASRNFRIQLVAAQIGATPVVNIIIEDAAGTERAIYGFTTSSTVATLIIAQPQAVLGMWSSFTTPRPRMVGQFEGLATIRSVRGATAGLGSNWKIELATSTGSLVIPINPGGINLLVIPAQGSLQRFQTVVTPPARP